MAAEVARARKKSAGMPADFGGAARHGAGRRGEIREAQGAVAVTAGAVRLSPPRPLRAETTTWST
jgi:hypothetical protein